MARVEYRRIQLLRESIGGVLLAGLAGLLLWLGCAFVARLVKWYCDAVDAIVVGQAKDGGCCLECERGVTQELAEAVGSEREGGAQCLEVWSSREGIAAIQKFYTVRQGRTPGLYFSWEDCSREITRYKGAKHKSFGSLIEAENYLFKP